MNIAIITQPIKANYGGTLQNFALQTVLRKLGHTPITIDYRDSSPLWFYILQTIKTTILYFIPEHRRKFTSYRNVEKRDEKMMNFVHKHMKLTDKEYLKYEKSVIKDYSIDSVIVGSDQVWRPAYNPGCLYDMFFAFLKNVSVRKIAYAASFGVDVWEYDKSQSKICRELAKKLDAVSVREKSGIELCKDYLGVEAQEVLDPTLLLDCEVYESVCSCVFQNKERYLCCYLLDRDEHKLSLIEKFANKNNCKLVCFSAHDQLKYSVEEWLAMFRDATYVITDSFHGTVFSIIFHKNFYSLINNERGGTRFVSLLTKFGLDDRVIMELPQTIVDIDWDVIDLRKKVWIEKSLKFLYDALK